MGLKKVALTVIWGLVIVAWIGMFVIKGTSIERDQFVLVVTGVAILTEAAFWLTAAVLGLSIWQARRKVFGFFTGRRASED